MDAIKLTEELVTIMALDSFRHDLYEMITDSETKYPNMGFIQDCYTISEMALKNKLKSFPEYEQLIKKFHDTYPEGYPETEGDTSSV